MTGHVQFHVIFRSERASELCQKCFRHVLGGLSGPRSGCNVLDRAKSYGCRMLVREIRVTSCLFCLFEA
jgi:hypothetical protein